MRKFMRWLFGLFIPDDHDPDEWVREAQRGAVEAWHVLKRPED